MAIYQIDPERLSISVENARAAAAPFAEEYQSGEPYNHICIDNFLPEEVLRKVQKDVATLEEGEDSDTFERAQENLKTQYNPERLPVYSRELFHAFNSRPFILFLEEMTGIKGLIPDPYYIGAGIHRVKNGGHLDIHADFNLHKQMVVERRLNVLIYLNDDWREEWGGSFEIWSNDMTTKVKSFVPTFNRMCCFSTGTSTFHGNPEKVNHPDGEPRQSIALYYYTATWDPSRKAHSTIFKPRPGTEDQFDRQSHRQEVLENWLPPVVYRRIYPRLARLGF
ncbi:2OG-Fe(II) oxygenase [Ruegeria conchae]|uniref:Rps23 Pro-64 3,4-dihydroxylase Tpa1-like proline 4-hydroxylase n=1 Tax=Ruegeria conchae TaxID=981384 RepID=A0A497ZFK3_9RHOB|nr:2OG-Fe(II) oxygenase [Ruegeria conchae]RLK07351.1 Rps23 Pro-64 3,4-dihydroxylase Tpa1-like proline 4-hydroxylase [Ruegeria conchae]UWR05128.1 2OG-Fe(II) oxygenase [Ruegeria conchae]